MSKSHHPAKQTNDPTGSTPNAARPAPAPVPPRPDLPEDLLADLVEEASDESFPASDPPAFTHTSATKDSVAHDRFRQDGND